MWGWTQITCFDFLHCAECFMLAWESQNVACDSYSHCEIHFFHILGTNFNFIALWTTSVSVSDEKLTFEPN